jgi:hypothetical protein
MTGSASFRPPEPVELRQLARSLVDVLTGEFDVGAIDLGYADLISSGDMSPKDHAACLGVMCAQQLHSLGNQRGQINAEDVFVLATMLHFVLRRIHDEDSQPAHAVREIHHRLVEIGLSMSRPLLRASERRLEGE